MPWTPSFPGEIPTLGWEVLDWIADNLAAPDRAYYEPFVPTKEQASFVLRFYELDPATLKRIVRRGVLSRARGWGKSPFLAAVAAAEALGPVVPDGWDATGQPVGMPWSQVRTPLVQIAAVSEEQTKNSWTPLLEMLRMGPVMDNYPGLEPMETFINLPQGRIETVTSSAATVKGNRAVFAVMDQTEEWIKGNGGHRLSDVMLNNATKIGGSTIESPNAFIPGMDSVAERTAGVYALMLEGKTKNTVGVLYDHREAPATTDIYNEASLLDGLAFTYGDSAEDAGGWVDLKTIAARINDTDMDPQLGRADFLNQITHASDQWIAAVEWNACAAPDVVIDDKDAIVLGFDGSRRRARGVTDATALMGCRVSDGHLFLVEVWEQPKGIPEWEIPQTAVDAKVRETFEKHNVVGFYADPALWESFIGNWEASFVKRLKIKASRGHPIEWRFNGNNIIEATARFHSAVLDNQLTHDGSSVVTRHVLNARRRPKGSTMQVMKENPESDHKIDAAIASILAWRARLDALSAGLGKIKTKSERRIIVFDD